MAWDQVQRWERLQEYCRRRARPAGHHPGSGERSRSGRPPSSPLARSYRHHHYRILRLCHHPHLPSHQPKGRSVQHQNHRRIGCSLHQRERRTTRQSSLARIRSVAVHSRCLSAATRRRRTLNHPPSIPPPTPLHARALTPSPFPPIFLLRKLLDRYSRRHSLPSNYQPHRIDSLGHLERVLPRRSRRGGRLGRMQRSGEGDNRVR
jgi:hypothetical protein